MKQNVNIVSFTDSRVKLEQQERTKLMLSIYSEQSVNLINSSGVTSDERLLEIWLFGKAKSTQSAYRRTVNNFLGFLNKPLQAITVADVFSWIESLNPNLKESTIKTKLYSVKSLLSFAAKTGYCSFNVGAAIKAPKVATGIHRKCLPVESIKAMSDHTERLRDSLIIRLGYVAGLRASEISALTWNSLHGDTLHVLGKGNKERSIKLPESILEQLQAFKPATATGDAPMFISRKHKGHLTRTSITRIIKDSAIKSGESDKVSAHWLRHSHAYNALKAGADVALLRDTLGHASLATTSQYIAITPNHSSAMLLGV